MKKGLNPSSLDYISDQLPPEKIVKYAKGSVLNDVMNSIEEQNLVHINLINDLNETKEQIQNVSNMKIAEIKSKIDSKTQAIREKEKQLQVKR